MTTSYPSLIKSAHASGSAMTGYSFTIKQLLSGVTGGNAAARLFNALQDPNVPEIGSDLSSIDESLTGCWLRKIDADALGADEVIITLHYQHSPVNEVQIDVSSQLSQIETNKDINGSPIELEYTYPSDYGGTDPSDEEKRLRSATKPQGGTISIQVPERTRTYRVRTTDDPTVIAAAYEGKVNNAPWWSGDAGTWLCSSVTGSSDNSGADWIVTYTFQYRTDGWDPEVIYNDVLTGNPIPDPVADESKKTVESYATATFTNMFPAA